MKLSRALRLAAPEAQDRIAIERASLGSLLRAVCAIALARASDDRAEEKRAGRYARLLTRFQTLVYPRGSALGRSSSHASAKKGNDAVGASSSAGAHLDALLELFVIAVCKHLI